eukprot:2518315-Rhodomonas_salina.2
MSSSGGNGRGPRPCRGVLRDLGSYGSKYLFVPLRSGNKYQKIVFSPPRAQKASGLFPRNSCPITSKGVSQKGSEENTNMIGLGILLNSCPYPGTRVCIPWYQSDQSKTSFGIPTKIWEKAYSSHSTGGTRTSRYTMYTVQVVRCKRVPIHPTPGRYPGTPLLIRKGF